MPTQKKGCDDDEIVGLFSPQRRLFRKSKAAVLFRAKVSYRLMYILHESAMTPTHSSLGILTPFNLLLNSIFEASRACASGQSRSRRRPAAPASEISHVICIHRRAAARKRSG